MAIRLVLLALLGAAQAENLHAPKLTQTDFEHRTQAATGQTTGIWLVHFMRQGCVLCRPLTDAIRYYDPEGSEEGVIMAEVDVDKDPALAQRFGVSDVPALLLFRDRQMYRHPDPARLAERDDEDGLGEALEAFASEAHEQVAPEIVPEEPTLVAQLVTAAKERLDRELQSGGKALIYGGAGLGVVVVGAVVALLLSNKSLQKRD